MLREEFDQADYEITFGTDPTKIQLTCTEYQLDERLEDLWHSRFPEIRTVLDNPLVVNDQFIRDWMGADEVFRGVRGHGVGWPLISDCALYALIIYFRHAIFQTTMPMNYSTSDADPRQGDLDHKAQMKKKPEFPTMGNWLAFWNNSPEYEIVSQILRRGRGHLILAGGAAASLLLRNRTDRRPWWQGDYDFFFIGLNEDQTDVAEDILRDVLGYLTSLKGEDGDRDREGVFWSQKAISLYVQTVDVRMDIQFVLRLYPDTKDQLRNISMPIGGFDLHSCACAISLDENFEPHFHATPAGAFALGTMTNVLMTSRNSTSMIHRLSKYNSRGFDVLFPGTSVEKMVSKTADNTRRARLGHLALDIVLPHLKIYLTVNRYLPQKKEEAETSDYGGEIFHYRQKVANALALLQEQPERYVIKTTGSQFPREIDWATAAQAQLEPSIKYLLDRYLITWEYLSQRKLDYESCQLLSRRLKRILESSLRGRFRAPELQKRLRFLEGLLRDLEARGDREGAAYLKQSVTDIEAKISQELHSKFSVAIDTMVHETRRKTLENSLFSFQLQLVEKSQETFEKVRSVSLPTWNTKNPLTQHTASNNPTITNAREWWGPENYVPFRVGFPDEIYFLMKIIFQHHLGGYGLDLFRKVGIFYCVRAWAEGVVLGVYGRAVQYFPSHLQNLTNQLSFKLRNKKPELRDQHLKLSIPGDLPAALANSIQITGIKKVSGSRKQLSSKPPTIVEPQLTNSAANELFNRILAQTRRKTEIDNVAAVSESESEEDSDFEDVDI